MIPANVQKLLNEQIVHELYSSNAYLAIASHLDGLGLKVLSHFFFRQSDEERMHALKFLHYVLEVGGEVEVGAVPAAPSDIASVEQAVETSLKQEQEVTRLIHAIHKLAIEADDYRTQSFLKWFIDEQIEEEATMTELLQLVRLAGPDNLLIVENRWINRAKEEEPA